MDEQMKKQSFNLIERVEHKLDGLAIAIEAKGADQQGTISHQTFSLIVYDIDSKTYRIQSLSQDGYVMRSEGQFEDGRLTWQVDVPHGILRYSIELKDDEWIEKGTYSADGDTWWPFMEIKLKRK